MLLSPQLDCVWRVELRMLVLLDLRGLRPIQ